MFGIDDALMIAATLGSGYMGMQATNAAGTAQANANNAAIGQGYENLLYQISRDKYNEGLQREFNRNAIDERERQLAMAKEGVSDAGTGSSTRYVPGKGWVTEYTPERQGIINAQNAEDLQNLTVDQPMARRGRVLNEQRRGKEGLTADAILAEISGANPYDANRITADISRSRRRGVNEGFDRDLETMLTQARRTGDSGANLAAAFSRERSKALQDLDAGSYVQGLQTAEGLSGDRSARLGNLYNMIAGRASNYNDVALPSNSIPSSNAPSAGSTPQVADRSSAVQVNPNAAQFDTSLFKPNYQQAYGYGVQGQTMGGLFDIAKRTLGNQKT